MIGFIAILAVAVFIWFLQVDEMRLYVLFRF